MKVTIKDIAAVAGVSHSTVSRALNDSPQISQATKDKIKDIASSMNFEFNSGARSLKSNKTGNIAVVYEAYYDQFGSSLYINQLFMELRHYLERMDMDAILLEGYHPETGASNIDRLLRQQKVDGFLIVHNNVTKKDYNSIIESGLPMVQLHMYPKNYNINQLNYFLPDNFTGGKTATEKLIELGCKKILSVYPDDVYSYEYNQRTKGYKNALENSGIEFRDDYCIAIQCTYNSGYNLFNTIPELLKTIDGIFFQTDIQAFGFLSAAKVRGVSIPESIKVIGFDDAPVCDSSIPQLSTIHQPRKELAERACRRIIELVNKQNTDSLVQEIIPSRLIMRGSC
ncbi:MAG: LacI family DNA-binding transcriptional regulator [Spirochaetales bacterium]|nr:LacI family DNA-binding transcriptional regulator [Spirochaetales bacterium]